MAKVRIPVEKLPAPNSNGDHVLQFRMISEDRNRTSAWSNLFIIKSIGQYRPLESDVTVVVGTGTIDLTWDTPQYYNYDGSSSAVVVDSISGSVSINSASVISHNHTQDFKRHDTDIYISWDDESFQYHDRVISDNTKIVIPEGKSNFRAIGVSATHGIPKRREKDSDLEFGQIIDSYLGNDYINGYTGPGYTNGVVDLFKIFDTQQVSLSPIV